MDVRNQRTDQQDEQSSGSAEPDKPPGATGRRQRPAVRLRNMAMATRISGTIVAVSIVALLVTTIVGLRTAGSLNRELDDDQLLAMQASGASDVAAHMESLRRGAAALAASPETRLALVEFTDGHRELLLDDSTSSARERNSLIEAHRERYVTPLRAIRPDIQTRDVAPENLAAVYLQTRYALTEADVAEPGATDDAGDGTRWNEVHARVHPVFRDIVERLELADLYLVEPESGYVVYSARKRPDLGTSLIAGPFSGSGLAQAVEQALRRSDEEVRISDLGFYPPALATPVGFVVAPVLSDDQLLGYLVLMYDGKPLDDLLSADRDWEAGRFPPTGEALMFGEDGTVRTEPRSFVEDPAAHLSAAVEAGMTQDDRRLVETVGSTVLTQSVAAPTLEAAEIGDDTVTERETLLGDPALSVVSPVSLADVEWFVLAEVQVDATEENLDDFAQLLIVGVAIVVVILSFAAVAWARRLIRPVRQISEQLGHGSDGVVSVDIGDRSPTEFHELSRSFESMTGRITDQRRRVADTRRQRLGLLRRMLPPAVAERLAAGQVQSIEAVPQASVVVVVVLGLGELLREGASESSRELVDRLLADLDALAGGHQLDRVKVVGDAYFAACGHDRPYIDHAPRSVAFALEARDAIRDLGGHAPDTFDATVGVHSGPVMAGMTGGEQSVYDVWGETVTTAHYLARRGERGQILLTDATRVLLPDSIDLVSEADQEGEEIWSVAAGSVRSSI